MINSVNSFNTPQILNNDNVQEKLEKSKQVVTDNFESNSAVKTLSGAAGESGSMRNSMTLVPLLYILDKIADNRMGGSIEKSSLGKAASMGDKLSDLLHLGNIFSEEKVGRFSKFLKENRFTKYFTNEYKAVPKSALAKSQSLAEKYLRELNDQTQKLIPDFAEMKYNPEIMDAFKMNVLPDIEEPAVTKQHIDYATAVRPFSAWEFIPMDAYPISQEQARNARGYIRAMYGNLNNVDAKGSYLWDITQRDRLGIMASVYGRNGDISSFNPEEDWKSRFYRTDVVLDYSHRFQKVSLAVGGSWGSQVFNFMPGYETVSSTEPLSGKQHYTLTEGYLSVSSVKDALPVNFSIQTGFRGFNRKYLIPFNGGDDFERIIHTKGYVSGNFNETQKIAIGFEMNNLMYDDRLTDNTLLQLNPYYTLKNDRVYFKVGAHVDWQIANKSGFKVAPDVQFDYVFADKYAVYIHALGGTRLNDFRSLNRLSPYWVKENQAVTSYTPLNGQIGLKASPVAGLGMKLFGGYRIVKNEMFVLPMYDPD